MIFNGPPEELMLFHDVHRAYRNAVSSALSAQGLQHVGQPRILMLLSAMSEHGATQRELAEAVHVSASTMAASLKSLEGNGYVTKHSDAEDGRCKRVCITQKGKDAVKRCHDALVMVDTQLYAGFTPDEMDRLKNDYRRMLNNLFAIAGEAIYARFDEPKPFRKEDKSI